MLYKIYKNVFALLFLGSFIACQQEVNVMPTTSPSFDIVLISDLSGSLSNAMALDTSTIAETITVVKDANVQGHLSAGHFSSQHFSPITISLKPLQEEPKDKYSLTFPEELASYQAADSLQRSCVKNFIQDFDKTFTGFLHQRNKLNDYTYLKPNLRAVASFLRDTSIVGSHKIAVIQTDFIESVPNQKSALVSSDIIADLNTALELNSNARLIVITDAQRVDLKADFVMDWHTSNRVLAQFIHSIKN